MAGSPHLTARVRLAVAVVQPSTLYAVPAGTPHWHAWICPNGHVETFPIGMDADAYLCSTCDRTGWRALYVLDDQPPIVPATPCSCLGSICRCRSIEVKRLIDTTDCDVTLISDPEVELLRPVTIITRKEEK